MVRVIFKHEDEDGFGRPIGPVWEIGEGDPSPDEPRPFDPNARPTPWVSLPTARKMAARHGVALEEV